MHLPVTYDDIGSIKHRKPFANKSDMIERILEKPLEEE